jgi:ADP-ribose pyrophosphatase YjhB (NUDIX family)
MATILCYDTEGNRVPVAAEAISFRPAVYGIFIEHDQILLLRHRQSELLQPPGSILADHGTPPQLIRHHFLQLTNVTPLLGPLLFVTGQYRLVTERAWHLSALYYALSRPTAAATTLSETEESTYPVWVFLNDLHRNQMMFGYEAVRAGQLNLELQSG